MHGHIVDLFYTRIQGKDAISGAGRLENGQSFGFIDTRINATLLVRASEWSRIRSLIGERSYSHSPFHTMDGEALLSINLKDLAERQRLHTLLVKKGLRTYEADLDFATSYRIDKGISSLVEISGESRRSDYVDHLFINPLLHVSKVPVPLRVLAFDIETNRDATEILGFSLCTWILNGNIPFETEEVHILGPSQLDDPPHLTSYAQEKELLLAFRERIKSLDPDILTGWNVIDFDLATLEKLFQKHGLDFHLGRTKLEAAYRKGRKYGQSRMHMKGRQVLDAMSLCRYSLTNFEDHRLGTVAETLLGRKKTLHLEEWEDAPAKIAEIFAEDRKAFCEYVLEDARLVRDILNHQKLLELSLKRSELTRLSLDRAWGSVSAFETLYISALHRRAMAAPSLGIDQDLIGEGSGGLVLEPSTGMHKHVLIFDFKSLYPSLIRTFNLDPLALISRKDSTIIAPNGASFSKSEAILPDILREFAEERELAKQRRDELGSYTYKIIMNSFYGVLGTEACRFADNRIADAITSFGQHLLRVMKEYFERQSYQVLYGDTDSLFIKVEELEELTVESILDKSKEIGEAANQFLKDYIQNNYQRESKLELEFDNYFRFAFFPPVRSGESGRAKNYAGLSVTSKGETLEIKGLEAVRSDWTPLAKDLQRALLKKAFDQTPSPEIVSFLKAYIKDLKSGRLDSELVYRKKIRRPLEAYIKTTPPHIKAARLLPKPVRVVRYLMTKKGPRPIGFIDAAIDYNHYLEKQIRPIVENLALYLGVSWLEIEGEPNSLKFDGTF